MSGDSPFTYHGDGKAESMVGSGENGSGELLLIRPEDGRYLGETRKWAFFFAILGFILCGFMVLGGMAVTCTMGMAAGMSDSPAPFFLIGLVYLVLAAIYFFPCLFLLRFSTNMKNALLTGDQELLTKSLKNQKSLFRFMGIMTIVVFALYIVAIIGMIGFGAFAAASGL